MIVKYRITSINFLPSYIIRPKVLKVKSLLEQADLVKVATHNIKLETTAITRDSSYIIDEIPTREQVNKQLRQAFADNSVAINQQNFVALSSDATSFTR